MKNVTRFLFLTSIQFQSGWNITIQTARDSRRDYDHCCTYNGVEAIFRERARFSLTAFARSHSLSSTSLWLVLLTPPSPLVLQPLTCVCVSHVRERLFLFVYAQTGLCAFFFVLARALLWIFSIRSYFVCVFYFFFHTTQHVSMAAKDNFL